MQRSAIATSPKGASPHALDASGTTADAHGTRAAPLTPDVTRGPDTQHRNNQPSTGTISPTRPLCPLDERAGPSPPCPMPEARWALGMGEGEMISSRSPVYGTHDTRVSTCAHVSKTRAPVYGTRDTRVSTAPCELWAAAPEGAAISRPRGSRSRPSPRQTCVKTRTRPYTAVNAHTCPDTHRPIHRFWLPPHRSWPAAPRAF